MFSFYFSRHEDTKSSELTLGGWDDSHMDGEPKWHEVADKYYWLLEADNILVNGEDLGLCKRGCRVVADTGTSLLTGPSDELMTLLGRFYHFIIKILDKLNIDENCKNVRDLPKLTFVIDNVHYDLDANDYVMKIDSDGNEVSIYPILWIRFHIKHMQVVTVMLSLDQIANVLVHSCL
jgi:cathepsin D